MHRKMGTDREMKERGLIISITDGEIRDWSGLPSELLEDIGTRLPLVELLAFRSACKNWRSASSTATAACGYASSEKPWFLLYNENSNSRLYQVSTDKLYTIDIPELNGSIALASREGWLLLARESSIFFFCPFSRAQIDLPEFPHSDLSKHIALFSTVPTSLDCVVCVINHSDNNTMELNTLKRSANKWTKYTDNTRMDIVTGAIFGEDVFYFLDSKNQVLTFSLGSEKCKRYSIVYASEQDKDAPRLPFSCARKSVDSNLKQKLGLGDGDFLSTCGTVQPGDQMNLCIHNEDLKTEGEQQQRQNKGVWIHPRFFQVPPNQSWGL